MKSTILPNCLKEKYGYRLGEFNNTSFVMFGTERVKNRSLSLQELFWDKQDPTPSAHPTLQPLHSKIELLKLNVKQCS